MEHDTLTDRQKTEICLGLLETTGLDHACELARFVLAREHDAWLLANLVAVLGAAASLEAQRLPDRLLRDESDGHPADERRRQLDEAFAQAAREMAEATLDGTYVDYGLKRWSHDGSGALLDAADLAESMAWNTGASAADQWMRDRDAAGVLLAHGQGGLLEDGLRLVFNAVGPVLALGTAVDRAGRPGCPQSLKDWTGTVHRFVYDHLDEAYQQVTGRTGP
jgi:hypothetical protein